MSKKNAKAKRTAALTEDAVRRGGRAAGSVGAQAWRREAQEVVARVREKVEAVLDER